MIGVTIIAVGKIKDDWITRGIAEYSKRMSAYSKFEVFEIDEYKIPQKASQAQINTGLEKEGEKILSKIPQRSKVVAMCIEGRQMSSDILSDTLKDFSSNASRVVFIIGSSYGMSTKVKERADIKLSLSKMTFPHQLTRLILSEQIYRALSIQAGSQYHK